MIGREILGLVGLFDFLLHPLGQLHRNIASTKTTRIAQIDAATAATMTIFFLELGFSDLVAVSALVASVGDTMLDVFELGIGVVVVPKTGF